MGGPFDPSPLPNSDHLSWPRGAGTSLLFHFLDPRGGDLSGGLAGNSPTLPPHNGNLVWERDLT